MYLYPDPQSTKPFKKQHNYKSQKAAQEGIADSKSALTRLLNAKLTEGLFVNCECMRRFWLPSNSTFEKYLLSTYNMPVIHGRN